jgi:hypothetical protein
MLHLLHSPRTDDFVSNRILEDAGIFDIVLQLLEYLLGPSQAVWIILSSIMLPESLRLDNDQLFCGGKAFDHSMSFLLLQFAVFRLFRGHGEASILSFLVFIRFDESVGGVNLNGLDGILRNLRDA